MIGTVVVLMMMATAPVDVERAAPLRVLVMDARAAADGGAPPAEVAGLTNVVCSALAKQPGLEVTCLPDIRAALDARALMASVSAPTSGKLEEKLAAVERVVTITIERRQSNYILVVVASTRAAALENGLMPVPDKPLAQVERASPSLGGFLKMMVPMTSEVAAALLGNASASPVIKPKPS